VPDTALSRDDSVELRRVIVRFEAAAQKRDRRAKPIELAAGNCFAKSNSYAVLQPAILRLDFQALGPPVLRRNRLPVVVCRRESSAAARPRRVLTDS
jgi:hypothetical protein